ncbi:MAG: replication initiation factor domain-containing protein [[Clostridium] scindens]|uniref:replication initiation factor domain-containing protein n=2 Tax=Clostridium scindens (strain JCM 10418 / VPI 12708) TaxID=29347 RepID=UPI003993EBE7
MIDWCQITVKDTDVFTIIEDILRIPLNFMELHCKGKGIAGHELIAGFDNIKILKPTGNAQYEGFQILMSGSGCRDYEKFLTMNQETWFDFLERVCRYNVNFPRIDLAIDDRKTYLSISELIRLKNEGLISSQLRDISENHSDKLTEDNIESNGKSLYIGSKNSDFRIIFYEKGYEQAEKFGKELDINWNRYELRFRKKKAVRLVQELLKDRNVARVAMSVLNDKVRFLQNPENSSVTRKRLYPTYLPWKEFMQNIPKIKLCMDSVPIDNYLQKNREWLIKNVAPSVKMQMIWDKMNNNKNDIFKEMSHARLNEKQKSALQTIEKHYELENYI